MESTGDDTWVAFGDNGKNVTTICINKLTDVPKRQEYDFIYTKYDIGFKVENPNMTVDGLKNILLQFCLFLPFDYNKKRVFEMEFAMICVIS